LIGTKVSAWAYLVAALVYLYYGVRSCVQKPLAEEIETLRPGPQDINEEGV